MVEDDRHTRGLLVVLLESRGYQVFAAEDGEEGFRKAKTYRPDLILLDLIMPVMDGWLFRERQLKEPSISEIPVIVLSTIPANAACLENLHVAAYLRKPFRIKDIVVAVSQHARREPSSGQTTPFVNAAVEST